jgi:hypothetical protein
MQLNDRLSKLATGVSVSDAIDAYLHQRAEGGEEIDFDAARTNELLAIVEIMFLMAAVDGEVADDEIQQLRASIEALADMRETPGLRLDETLATLNTKLSQEGWKRRLEDACSRLHAPDARSFAFRLAAGVAFVDDFVAHAEAAAIDALARALDLDREESQDILREVHETLFGG